MQKLKFDKLNVHIISLHRIIFSKYGYNLLLLRYDEYHENDNLYLISNEPFTIGSMKKYVREYFGRYIKLIANETINNSIKNNNLN